MEPARPLLGGEWNSTAKSSAEFRNWSGVIRTADYGDGPESGNGLGWPQRSKEPAR